MTIVLRLQGLHVKAGAEDIRKFFDGLHVPEGGVCIVGGSLREAFIAFTTERDGQLAMRFSGSLLKGTRVTLHISSMAEVEHKIKSKLKHKKLAKLRRPVKKPQPRPPADSPPADPRTVAAEAAVLFDLILQGLQQSQHTQNTEEVQSPHCMKSDETSLALADDFPSPEEAAMVKPGYVRLFGLPTLVTKGDICHFFEGLLVEEVIVNIKLGLKSGCLVKFANFQDGCDALLLNGQQLGSACVEVRGATEKMWNSAVQECEDLSTGFDEMNGTVLPSVTQNMEKSRPAHELMNPKGSPVRKHREKSPPAVQAAKDNGGNGIGEVVVQFKSAKQAARAQGLHGQMYQGAELLLSCISLKQMEDILNRNPWKKGTRGHPGGSPSRARTT
ncbi:RNA binding motif protein 12Ba isoform X2 [Lampris incognitus]|uniref:RNA binding motif protein 12Ba isoform X2 n=1 Tax=Lampris incognitus TaxID=2546036 RepID=UPI0024B4F054|nr:RNA binding motif protein 12Ba isoform X2 [Lampris incognitus]